MPTMVMVMVPMAMVHVMMHVHKRDLAVRIDSWRLRNRCRRCGEGEAYRRDGGDDSMR